MLVSGQQRRQQLQPSLLPQALQAGVHHRGADPLLVVSPKLLVAQPEQKFLRVQVHFRGDLGQLVKPRPVPVPQHLGQILHQAVVQGHAVQQHLEGVLSGVRVRLLRLFRLFRVCVLRPGQLGQGLRVEAVEHLLGDLRAVLGGTHPHQGGDVAGLLQ